MSMALLKEDESMSIISNVDIVDGARSLDDVAAVAEVQEQPAALQISCQS